MTNKTINLSIIDIDINKTFDDEHKNNICEEILNKLSSDDIIVKTASGGLHIYANTNESVINQNRCIKCYKCNDFDIDIFTSFDEESR